MTGFESHIEKLKEEGTMNFRLEKIFIQHKIFIQKAPNCENYFQRTVPTI